MRAFRLSGGPSPVFLSESLNLYWLPQATVWIVASGMMHVFCLVSRATPASNPVQLHLTNRDLGFGMPVYRKLAVGDAIEPINATCKLIF